MKDKQIADHFARMLADWKTRRLIAYMIFDSDGDITVFVEGYRETYEKIQKEEREILSK